MKKFLLLAFVLVFGTSVLKAQNRKARAEKSNFKLEVSSPSLKTANVVDTLWLMHVIQNAVIYTSLNGGYVAGHNGWGDTQKAQKFYNPSPTQSLKVLGAMYWFAGKKQTSGNNNSFVYAWVSDTTGTGTDSTHGTTSAPGANFITTKRIVIANIDTSLNGAGGFFPVSFDSNYVVGPQKAFFVGLGLDSTAAGDTVGLVMSKDSVGLTPVPDLSWEKWNTGQWFSILKAWKTNSDIAIFPIVEYFLPTNLNALPTLNGLGFLPYPNPATNVVNIRYEIPFAGKVKFEIYNTNGQILKTFDLGQKAQGTHTTSLDISELNQGTYFLGIDLAGKKIFQKLQVK